MEALESAEIRTFPKLILRPFILYREEVALVLTATLENFLLLSHCDFGSGEGYYSIADESSFDHLHL